MYSYKARIYSPTHGRFLQNDPAGRTWGHAARLGMQRFIPCYLQASLIVGGVKATFELFSNPSCGLSE